jgi:hypothetical protein
MANRSNTTTINTNSSNNSGEGDGGGWGGVVGMPQPEWNSTRKGKRTEAAAMATGQQPHPTYRRKRPQVVDEPTKQQEPGGTTRELRVRMPVGGRGGAGTKKLMEPRATSEEAEEQGRNEESKGGPRARSYEAKKSGQRTVRSTAEDAIAIQESARKGRRGRAATAHETCRNGVDAQGHDSWDQR